MKRALVFPGQGSQAPGMGRELAAAFAAARLLFEEIDEALAAPLSRLLFEGPEAELRLTESAQPALLAASLAVIRVLESEAGFDIARDAAYVAGHSLGEYAALAAAGALPVAVAARLVRRRGQAMQQAVREAGIPLRIYTPVGDLIPGMAYLIRRILENTSQYSFLAAGLTEGTPIGV